MRQILAIACFMFLALVLMDSYQVVKAPSGLTIVKAERRANDVGSFRRKHVNLINLRNRRYQGVDQGNRLGPQWRIER
jgi:hypothetical protein